jgi:hypothetical protein
MNLVNLSHIVIKNQRKKNNNIELDLTPHPCNKCLEMRANLCF